MLGVLMVGPGGGAATIATAGSSNSSEMTNAIFLVNDDIRFHNVSRAAGTYLSCNHEALRNKILSGYKVSLSFEVLIRAVSSPNLSAVNRALESDRSREETLVPGR
jgi:hypothetical protein